MVRVPWVCLCFLFLASWPGNLRAETWTETAEFAKLNAAVKELCAPAMITTLAKMPTQQEGSQGLTQLADEYAAKRYDLDALVDEELSELARKDARMAKKASGVDVFRQRFAERKEALLKLDGPLPAASLRGCRLTRLRLRELGQMKTGNRKFRVNGSRVDLTSWPQNTHSFFVQHFLPVVYRLTQVWATEVSERGDSRLHLDGAIPCPSGDCPLTAWAIDPGEIGFIEPLEAVAPFVPGLAKARDPLDLTPRELREAFADVGWWIGGIPPGTPHSEWATGHEYEFSSKAGTLRDQRLKQELLIGRYPRSFFFSGFEELRGIVELRRTIKAEKRKKGRSWKTDPPWASPISWNNEFKQTGSGSKLVRVSRHCPDGNIRSVFSAPRERLVSHREAVHGRSKVAELFDELLVMPTPGPLAPGTYVGPGHSLLSSWTGRRVEVCKPSWDAELARMGEERAEAAKAAKLARAAARSKAVKTLEACSLPEEGMRQFSGIVETHRRACEMFTDEHQRQTIWSVVQELGEQELMERYHRIVQEAPTLLPQLSKMEAVALQIEEELERQEEQYELHCEKKGAETASRQNSVLFKKCMSNADLSSEARRYSATDSFLYEDFMTKKMVSCGRSTGVTSKLQRFWSACPGFSLSTEFSFDYEGDYGGLDLADYLLDQLEED